MPQLEEDEWPKTDQPTTTEQEHLKESPRFASIVRPLRHGAEIFTFRATFR